jgi:hypothetical protein
MAHAPIAAISRTTNTRQASRNPIASRRANAWLRDSSAMFNFLSRYGA